MQTRAICHCPHVRTVKAVEAAFSIKRRGLQQRDRTPLTAKAQVSQTGVLLPSPANIVKAQAKFCSVTHLALTHSTSLNHQLSLLLSNDISIYRMKHRMPLSQEWACGTSPMIRRLINLISECPINGMHDTTPRYTIGTDRFGPFIPHQCLFYISYICRILLASNRSA